VADIDLWTTLVNKLGEWQSSEEPRGQAGAMAYVLARVDGRSCAEAKDDADRAARRDVVSGWRVQGYWRGGAYRGPPVEAPIEAWRRWCHPRPVSLAAAHERDAARRASWGQGPGPAFSEAGTLDAVWFLQARGLLE
jgi:hypothetical protein